MDSELMSFPNSPRCHRLAADAISEVLLALNDQHPVAALGHSLGEAGAAQPAANRDYVVLSNCYPSPANRASKKRLFTHGRLCAS